MLHGAEAAQGSVPVAKCVLDPFGHGRKSNCHISTGRRKLQNSIVGFLDADDFTGHP